MSLSVYRYLDYRSYLKDLFDQYRKKSKKTARTVFQEAGFKSLGHFYLITSGKTNLTEDKLEALAKSWGMPNSQIEYLLRLREFCISKSLSQKKKIYKELEVMRSSLRVKLLSKDEIEQMCQWYAIPFLESLATRFASTAPEKFAKAVGIKTSELQKLLPVFERLGLVVKTESGYRRNEGAFEAYLQGSSKFLRAMHKGLLEKAFQSVDQFPEPERLLMALSLPIETNKLALIKEQAHEFFQKINRQFDSGAKANAVYQINLQIFPMIRDEA